MAAYGPNDSRAIYASESLAHHSFVDPFAPDLDAYPLFRGATAVAATLAPGDILIVPCDWHVTWCALEPYALVSKAFYAASNAALHSRATIARMRQARASADEEYVDDAPLDDDAGTSSLSAAEAFKEKGNAAFARTCYREAAAAYGRCLEAVLRGLGGDDGRSGDAPPEDRPALRRVRLAALCNRAACAVRRRTWHDGLEDADAVVRSATADPIIVKALYRRGQCRAGLGDADGALVDFKHAAELDPTSKDVADAVELFENPLHRAIVRQAVGK